MEQNEIIETIGSITKMEDVCSLEKDILKNTLVLRSLNPFPGVKADKGTGNSFEKPGSVFIILRYRYAPEKINRINKKLLENRITDCYPSSGEIITSNLILPCIRVKKLSSYESIPVIQNFFKRNDLKLMDYQKIQSAARIKIFKHFKLVEIGEGLYRDLNDGEKIYIRVPYSLNWKKFDFISRKIRHGLKNSNFDAALGNIYRFCGPEDVIRIYDQDKSLSRAMELRNHFLKELKKDMPISADLYIDQN
ncbi:MAG: hypothetical protein JW801_00185 [Bacteroidales bacterium]|nr:hypothetical protein [Bacteroidales bacterium]